MNLRLRFQISSELERHADARRRLERFLRATGKPLDEAAIHEMQLALDEALSNISRHSYQDHAGPIDLEFIATDQDIQLVLRDKGSGWKKTPGKRPLPSPEQEGGRGLGILEGVMGEVSFQRSEEGENILRLCRHDSHPGWIPPLPEEVDPC